MCHSCGICAGSCDRAIFCYLPLGSATSTHNCLVCEIGETMSEAALAHSAREHLWPATARAENTGTGAREAAAALGFLFFIVYNSLAPSWMCAPYGEAAMRVCDSLTCRQPQNKTDHTSCALKISARNLLAQHLLST